MESWPDGLPSPGRNSAESREPGPTLSSGQEQSTPGLRGPLTLLCGEQGGTRTVSVGARIWALASAGCPFPAWPGCLSLPACLLVCPPWGLGLLGDVAGLPCCRGRPAAATVAWCGGWRFTNGRLSERESLILCPLDLG